MAFGNPQARFEILAEDRSAAAFNQVSAHLKEVEAGFLSLKTAASVALAAFSATEIISFAKATFEAADAIGDMASRLNVSASSLAKLKFAADQNDVVFESLTKGIRELEKSLTANDPVFAKLGLNAAELKKLDLDKQLELVADAFKNTVKPADQVSVSTELFKKTGYELIPLLNQGSVGLRAFADEATRTGKALNDDAYQAIGNTDAVLKSMKTSVEAAATSMLVKLAPAIDSVAHAITRAFSTQAVDPIQIRLDNINDGIKKTSALIDELTLRHSRAGTVRLSDESVAGERVGASRAGAGFDIGQLRASMASLTAERDALQAKIDAGNAATIAGVQAVTEISAEEAAKQRRLDEILANDRIAINQMVNEALYESHINGSALYAQLAAEDVNVQKASLDQQISNLEQFKNSQAAILGVGLEDHKWAADQSSAYQEQFTSMAIQGLAQFGQKSKSAAVASIALHRGMAIAQIGMNIAEANTAAVSLGPWGWALIAANVALGAAEIANVNKAANGGGLGSSSVGPGSAVNPIFTNQSGNDTGTQGAKQQNVTQIFIQGNYGWDDYINNKVIAGIQEAISDRDVVIISPTSRQAAELIPA